MSAPVPAIHLPISGPAEPESYAGLLEEYEATAILATPTTLVKLAQYLTTQGKTLPKVHAIMFGGEPLHPDQTVFLKKVFPNATSRSCILGSMDAGQSISLSF
jgi:phenylacetate-CoA ligase